MDHWRALDILTTSVQLEPRTRTFEAIGLTVTIQNHYEGDIFGTRNGRRCKLIATGMVSTHMRHNYDIPDARDELYFDKGLAKSKNWKILEEERFMRTFKTQSDGAGFQYTLTFEWVSN